MTRIVLLSVALVCLVMTVPALAQQDPIHWQYSAVKVGEGDYELHFTAAIDEGWHAYSQIQPKEAVAMPTQISITANPLVQIKNPAREVGDLIKWSDPGTGIAAHQFSHKVDFVQAIHLKAKVKTQVKGSLTFQACTDAMCLPPKTVPFSIPLP